MKAMVLAAGVGLRMRPLTSLHAKPVLPVLNRPLVHHTLELLARHGVTEVVINTHHRPETVEKAVGSGRRFGLRVRYSYEPDLLGTGGGPRKVRDFFRGEPLALLVNGDVLFDFDLRQLVRRHLMSGARATLALKPNPDVKVYSPVVSGPDGFIRSIAGRPRRARGRLSLFASIHLLDPALLERLPAGPSDSVRDLYIPMLAAGERLLGVRMAGPWYDLGRPAAYLSSQLVLLSRRPDTTRDGSLVDGRARLGRRARAIASVVGSGAVIGEGAVVRRSIVWAGARVAAQATVRDSIVATGARIGAGERVVRQVVTAAGRAPLA
jgi:NDP-sugar pyrophosphorylase family protein